MNNTCQNCAYGKRTGVVVDNVFSFKIVCDGWSINRKRAPYFGKAMPLDTTNTCTLWSPQHTHDTCGQCAKKQLLGGNYRTVKCIATDEYDLELFKDVDTPACHKFKRDY